MYGRSPEGEGRENRETDSRAKLEAQWQVDGSVEVDGVSREEKHDFAVEKLKETDRKIAELWQQAKALERLRDLYAEDAPASGSRAADFTEEEREWFAKGENPDHMTLEASWEVNESLDVDDISDEAKASFAKGKLAALRGALRLGMGDARALDEKIRKLELYVEQYGTKGGV